MNCKYSLLALSLVAAFSVMAEEVTLPSTGNEYNITDKDSYDNAEADYYYVKEKGSLNIKDGGYIHGNSLTMSDESMFRVENGGAAVFEGDINIDGLALNEKTVAGEGDRNLTGGGSLDVVGNITVNVYAGNGNSFQVGDKGKLTAGAVTVSNDGVAINNAGYIEPKLPT